MDLVIRITTFEFLICHFLVVCLRQISDQLWTPHQLGTVKNPKQSIYNFKWVSVGGNAIILMNNKL